MTGIELLKEELRKRGATAAQVESKLVAMVLDIVAETGNVYTDYKSEELRLKAERRKLLAQDALLESSSLKIQLDTKQLKRDTEKFNERLEEAKAYIAKFEDALKDCETAEGRDKMRAAQVFINSTNIDSKYDNTAYIIGLASILSNSEFGAIDELKKIIPTLFGAKKDPSRVGVIRF